MIRFGHVLYASECRTYITQTTFPIKSRLLGVSFSAGQYHEKTLRLGVGVLSP